MARQGFKNLPSWVRVTLWGTLAVVAAAILVPAALQAFVAGLRGDYNPDVKRIDPSACEFVLTSDRSETFLRCPVPDGYQIPNWPDKRSPLNESGE